jgi:uncharacterized protein (TIGR01319 family)
MTAATAQRAALGAGAIVTDVISIDDGTTLYDKLSRISTMRPDMLLISGGVDGGNVTHVVKLAELLYAAGVRPRHWQGRVPVIYAGNRDARDYVNDILSRDAYTKVVDNLRPQMEIENTAPARREIQETFMSHVMVQAPHYAQLAELMSIPIVPTPFAVGKAIEYVGEKTGYRVLACDIGGATTDFFAYGRGFLHRTVSANLGMSYSISNVLAQAGLPAIQRYIPYPCDENELANTVANKMIRPTSLPATPAELAIEQAVARAALSLAFKHHQELTRDVRGVQRRREISHILAQDPEDKPMMNIIDVDFIIGSGSVVSMAPRRSQAAAMLLDSIAPEGVTHLAVDSQFVLPQIGLISEHYPEVAWEVLWRFGLTSLGTVVAPVFSGTKRGTPVARLAIRTDRGHVDQRVIRAGDLFVVPFQSATSAELVITPLGNVDVGSGPGKTHEAITQGGVVGIILDGRGRPLPVPSTTAEGLSAMLAQAQALDLYSRETIQDFARRGGVRR